MQALSPAKTEQRILKARIALSLRQPFLASSIMRLPIKNATVFKWCKTMATDGYHIFFNEDWASKLSQAELRGVLAHEILHVLFQHSSRRAHRQPLRWNIAADHAINLLLIEQGFLLPEGGIADPVYRGKTAEEIYSLLPCEVTYESGNSEGENESSDDMTGCIPEIGLDVIDLDDIQAVAARDADMPDRSQIDELCRELRSEAKSKLAGRAAGLFSLESIAAGEGKLNWRLLLQSWLVNRIKSDWSIWPYSKKHVYRGIFMPSVGIEAPGHIIFAVDTSASMESSELKQIFSEIRFYRETYPCQLTVIQADADIQSVLVYGELDGVEIPRQVGVKGRGGTDFRPVFKWSSEHAPQALLIYATDGFGTFPDNRHAVDTLWLLTTKHAPANVFPFGLCVKL